MPKQIIWAVTGVVALILVAVAIGPNAGPAIQRDGIAAIAASFGILALLRPQALQAWLQKNLRSAAGSSAAYRIMGCAAIYVAAALAFPNYVPQP